VFRYSVPERFRVITLPKATYLEAVKADLANNSYPSSVRSIADSGDESLIRMLKKDDHPIFVRGRVASLPSLYSERVGDFGGKSIEAHTLQGLAQFEKYSPRFQWAELFAPPNVGLKRTIHIAYALHDIGKPLAAEMKTSHEQVSAEILVQVMNRMGFTKAEVDLARTLVGNDVIGKMIQGAWTPQEAFEKLVEIAKQTNLSPRDFFRLQSFFYTMDASTYSDLAALFTKEVTPGGEMLLPRSEKYRVLRNLFENAIFEE
jgi:hypothetical protein